MPLRNTSGHTGFCARFAEWKNAWENPWKLLTLLLSASYRRKSSPGNMSRADRHHLVVVGMNDKPPGILATIACPPKFFIHASFVVSEGHSE